MPSEKAMELADNINDAYGCAKDELDCIATLIDTALAEARLEGVKAMQEHAADLAAMDATIYQGGESPSGRLPCERSCAEGEIACRKIGHTIRALDPQQVINESMGK